MCLFVVDGTWSRDFNSKSLGLDNAGKSVGNLDIPKRSNSRKFYDESRYLASQKFYYSGPSYGVTGADARTIYRQVVQDIEREIVNGSCTELSLVGWSRGAAIVSEIAQGLMSKEFARIYRRISRQTTRGVRHKNVVVGQFKMLPRIKFVGLFDSVSMIPSMFSRTPKDEEWGEEIPKQVDYFVHITATDRTGPMSGLIDFIPRNPNIKALDSFTIPVTKANHSDVGGFSDTTKARFSYELMRSHANKAGVK